MGRKAQPKPRKLAVKLRKIRMLLGISQRDMLQRLSALAPSTPIMQGHISQFESGKRVPSLLVLLAYAQIAGISTDILINDRLELPEEEIPRLSSEWIMPKNMTRRFKNE